MRVPDAVREAEPRRVHKAARGTWEPVFGGDAPGRCPHPNHSPTPVPNPLPTPLCPRGAARGQIQRLLLHQQSPREHGGHRWPGGGPREKPRVHQGPRTPLPSLLGNSPALILPGYQGLTQPWLQFIRNNNHKATRAGRKFPIFPHFLPPPAHSHHCTKSAPGSWAGSHPEIRHAAGTHSPNPVQN